MCSCWLAKHALPAYQLIHDEARAASKRLLIRGRCWVARLILFLGGAANWVRLLAAVLLCGGGGAASCFTPSLLLLPAGWPFARRSLLSCSPTHTYIHS